MPFNKNNNICSNKETNDNCLLWSQKQSVPYPTAIFSKNLYLVVLSSIKQISLANKLFSININVHTAINIISQSSDFMLEVIHLSYIQVEVTSRTCLICSICLFILSLIFYRMVHKNSERLINNKIKVF